jgi:hypothetical protein
MSVFRRNRECITKFGYQLPGYNIVYVEEVNVDTGEVLHTYSESRKNFHRKKNPIDKIRSSLIRGIQSVKGRVVT